MVADAHVIILLLISLSITGEAEVYIATMEGHPVINYEGGVDGFEATALEANEKFDPTGEPAVLYSHHLEGKHNAVLDLLFAKGTYEKLYSYKHLINGFAVRLSPDQAEILKQAPGIRSVEKDWKVMRLTTHTPKFLGLPTGVWPSGGGFDRAGEDIVIGFVDSGIYPGHPSFSSRDAEPYAPLPNYRGKCELGSDGQKFCNGKIVGAQHFGEAAKAAGAFNPTIDFDSPLDGDGHGSHIAATAAGNNGVAVRMHGYEFGRASGMAPRARIAVYKVLYRLFGGFVADVVAAIDQAVRDGVDVLNLSVGPNSPSPETTTTFLNPFDAALLSAVKAGVFVAQAAGNGGPFPRTVLSYGPWIASVAAAIDDRRYVNHLSLQGGATLPGIGLSRATHGNGTMMYVLVAASDVLLDSSATTHGALDCQRPEVLNRNLVEGNILLCGYSFNFVTGAASVRGVSESARSLGAAGFVLAVDSASFTSKAEPVPVGVPGILIRDVRRSSDLLTYYNATTQRDWRGRVTSFGARGSIAGGLAPSLHWSAPEVAVFSSRGPDIRDFRQEDADLLKPDILAPGSLIWAAWSPNGTDDPDYVTEEFALVSGTSMASPHIAGIAALLRQRNPRWSPAAVKSALMTTSGTVDRAGRPIRAQHYAADGGAVRLVLATPFDFGSGHVDPHAALDPGLVFDAGHADYVEFLCATPGINASDVRAHAGADCGSAPARRPVDLNVPSIAVARLRSTVVVTRTVTSVADEEETYVISARMDPDVAIDSSPPAMTLRPGDSRSFTVTLTPRSSSAAAYSFGHVLLKGSRGHLARIPVVAMPVQ